MEPSNFWTELVRPQPTMIFYRILFPTLGLVLGWLLGQKNKSERDFRKLSETVTRFHREIKGPAILMHTKWQVLLTKQDWHLSYARSKKQFVYERSLEIQAI